MLAECTNGAGTDKHGLRGKHDRIGAPPPPRVEHVAGVPAAKDTEREHHRRDRRTGDLDDSTRNEERRTTGREIAQQVRAKSDDDR